MLSPVQMVSFGMVVTVTEGTTVVTVVMVSASEIVGGTAQGKPETIITLIISLLFKEEMRSVSLVAPAIGNEFKNH